MSLIDHEARRRRRLALDQLRVQFEVETLDTVIRQAVRHAWTATAHDANLTASLLGISRSTLYRYLTRFGFDRWTHDERDEDL